MHVDLTSKVLHYGAFKETLDKMVDILRSEYAGSIVVRGSAGSGKKTLIKEAIAITKVKSVTICAQHYNDDYGAMKAIAHELGFDSRAPHIVDLMESIKTKSKNKDKLVIILIDFEEFCRKRQSLLYNLMDLIHTDPNRLDRGLNLTLIGLTSNLDWAENIEKRVRSRLNAKCINLPLPYSNSKEFLEFTSQLIDNHEMSADFKEHLEYIYYFSSRSIRYLKKFLNNICLLDKSGKVVEVNFDPNNWSHDYQLVMNNFLRERLRQLTRKQLEILKLAMAHCDIHSQTHFSLTELEKSSKRLVNFDPRSKLVIDDMTFLLRLRLIKPSKLDQVVSEEAIFYPATTPKQFKAVIEGDHLLQHGATDHLWKGIKGR